MLFGGNIKKDLNLNYRRVLVLKIPKIRQITSNFQRIESEQVAWLCSKYWLASKQEQEKVNKIKDKNT